MVMASASWRAALHEADAAVILDAIDGESRLGQAESGKDRWREIALESEVVDGHHRLRRRLLGVVQKDRREAGMPIVCVDDVGGEGGDLAGADIGGGAPERGKTLPVVGPVVAVRAEIGIARPVEEVRRIHHDEAEAGRLAGDQPRLAPEEPGVAMHGLRLLERRHDRGIARHHDAHVDVVRLQRRGKRADDIGEAAGLDQRKNLGGDGEDGDHSMLLIIIWVMRQTPLSVRRKRLASSYGILADDQALGDMDAAVDDDLLEADIAADTGTRQDHRLVDGGKRIDAHAGEQQRAADAASRKRCSRRQPSRRSRCRGGRRGRGRTSPAPSIRRWSRSAIPDRRGRAPGRHRSGRCSPPNRRRPCRRRANRLPLLRSSERRRRRSDAPPPCRWRRRRG